LSNREDIDAEVLECVPYNPVSNPLNPCCRCSVEQYNKQRLDKTAGFENSNTNILLCMNAVLAYNNLPENQDNPKQYFGFRQGRRCEVYTENEDLQCKEGGGIYDDKTIPGLDREVQQDWKTYRIRGCTDAPTLDPTLDPTENPSKVPTANPTLSPQVPSLVPTDNPLTPTVSPTRPPSLAPTSDPTRAPTHAESVCTPEQLCASCRCDEIVGSTTIIEGTTTLVGCAESTVDLEKEFFSFRESDGRCEVPDSEDDGNDQCVNNRIPDPGSQWAVYKIRRDCPPTSSPTLDPSIAPTAPSNFPTSDPTRSPTVDPTLAPTKEFQCNNLQLGITSWEGETREAKIISCSDYCSEKIYSGIDDSLCPTTGCVPKLVKDQSRCNKPWTKYKDGNIADCREVALQTWRDKNAHVRFNFNIDTMICHVLQDDETKDPDDPTFDGSFCDESRMVDTDDPHWGIYESICVCDSNDVCFEEFDPILMPIAGADTIATMGYAGEFCNFDDSARDGTCEYCADIRATVGQCALGDFTQEGLNACKEICEGPDTVSPTKHPTSHPTLSPIAPPSRDPTTQVPSLDPSFDPTVDPSLDPTLNPTKVPTKYPSFFPTVNPTELFCLDDFDGLNGWLDDMTSAGYVRSDEPPSSCNDITTFCSYPEVYDSCRISCNTCNECMPYWFFNIRSKSRSQPYWEFPFEPNYCPVGLSNPDGCQVLIGLTDPDVAVHKTCKRFCESQGRQCASAAAASANNLADCVIDEDQVLTCETEHDGELLCTCSETPAALPRPVFRMLPLCEKLQPTALDYDSCRCDHKSGKSAIKSFLSVDACMARAYALGHRYFGYNHANGRCEIYTQNELEQCLTNMKPITDEGGYESFRITLHCVTDNDCNPTNFVDMGGTYGDWMCGPFNTCIQSNFAEQTLEQTFLHCASDEFCKDHGLGFFCDSVSKTCNSLFPEPDNANPAPLLTSTDTYPSPDYPQPDLAVMTRSPTSTPTLDPTICIPVQQCVSCRCDEIVGPTTIIEQTTWIGCAESTALRGKEFFSFKSDGRCEVPVGNDYDQCVDNRIMEIGSQWAIYRIRDCFQNTISYQESINSYAPTIEPSSTNPNMVSGRRLLESNGACHTEALCSHCRCETGTKASIRFSDTNLLKCAELAFQQSTFFFSHTSDRICEIPLASGEDLCLHNRVEDNSSSNWSIYQVMNCNFVWRKV